jgi:hypothetical protein
MSTLTIVALALAVGITALALATRRKAVDPLARTVRSGARNRGSLFARLRATDIESAALAVRQGRRDEALARLRENMDGAEAQRVIEEIEAQLAKNGPLVRLLDTVSKPGDPT